MYQVLTQLLLNTVVFTMEAQLLVHLSTLNILCKIWTHIVNSELSTSILFPIHIVKNFNANIDDWTLKTHFG